MMSEDTENTGTTAGDAAEKPPAKKAVPRKRATTAKKTATAKKTPATKKAAPRTAATKKAASTSASKSTAAKAAATKPAAAAKKSAAADTASGQESDQPTKTQETPDLKAGDAHDASPTAASESDAGSAGGEQDFDTAAERDWMNDVKRGAFMLLFGVLGWFAVVTGFTLAAIQFVVLLITGAPNDTLQNIIVALGRYVGEVMDYLSFKTDEMPFPFGNDIPSSD